MASTDMDKVIILAVEDNKDNYFVNQLTIRSIGVRPERYKSWSSGELLLKWLDTNEGVVPDLILLDLQLPHTSGYAVLAAVRAIPRLQETKIVALTANVMEADIQRCREAGFDGFIGKPTVPERFPDQLRRILAGEAVWESS